jgi:hypothetical protein
MGPLDPCPDPGGQKLPTNKVNKKSKENSYFEVLNVLLWGLKASPVASVFGHQNPRSGLDPDPDSMNPDPQLWQKVSNICDP